MFNIFKEVVQAALILAAIITALVFMSLPAEAAQSDGKVTKTSLGQLIVTGVGTDTSAAVMDERKGGTSYYFFCINREIQIQSARFILGELLSTQLSERSYSREIKLSAAASGNDEITVLMLKAERVMKGSCK